MSLTDDTQEQSTAGDAGVTRPFQAGEVIFRQGDPSTEAYLLEEGTVRLFKKVRGVDRHIAVLRAGALFGESALVAAVPRPSTAVAVTAGVARPLDPANVAAMFTREPEAGARAVVQLATRLYDAEEQIELTMLTDVQSKIVSVILKLAEKARGQGPGAAFSVSPMELSARVALDVETVKRTVSQLREGQYLRAVEGRLEVPDIDALRRLYVLLGVKEDLRGEV